MTFDILEYHPAELAGNLAFLRFSGLPILLSKSRSYFYDPIFQESDMSSQMVSSLHTAVSNLGEAAHRFPHSVTVNLSEMDFLLYKDTIRQLTTANHLYVGEFFTELGTSISYRADSPDFIAHLKHIIPQRMHYSSDLKFRSLDENLNYIELSVKNVGKYTKAAGTCFLQAYESSTKESICISE